MNLFFQWKDIPHRQRGLTFDDVLIVPARSDVRSRREPSLSTRLTKNHRIELPFISANMDTITEARMAIAMAELGAFGILHRFLSIEDQVKQAKEVRETTKGPVSASVGVTEDEKRRAQSLIDAGVDILTLDIAHGHSIQMLEMMEWIKKVSSKTDIIAGNMATPEAAQDLINAGADAIKVGIGPGSMCTTRVITGCGVPQLTAIALCAEVAQKHNVPLIADGGLKTSGDIMKAFAAGADSVMLGSMFSGTLETPGEVTQGRKLYRGMASRSAQESWRGGVPEGMAPEGESTSVPVKGHAKDVVMELAGGVRSGMSYINATALEEIKEKARFIEMSGSGLYESRAHGVRG